MKFFTQAAGRGPARGLPRILLSSLVALAMAIGLVVFANGISQASPDDAPTITEVTTADPAAGVLTVDFVPPVDDTIPV
ncbi:MAG: hypothetical protein WC005_06085, partial [Candidatus Nanopelagicales bacterium]